MITKRGGFRPWVKQIMPTVFDESLSYYELLSKVIGYLNQLNDQANEIIDYLDENVDEQNEEITKIRNEMLNFTKDTNEIQLDFTNEINQKIVAFQDEMNKFKGDSLAEQLKYMTELRTEFDLLKARIEGDILPEKIAEILNTWLSNGKLADIINEDVFNMKANQEDLLATIEDVTTIETTLIGWANVKSFGAIGDGVADDSQAIQNALNASLTVFFPSGDYKCHEILVPAGRKLIGATKMNQWGTPQFKASTLYFNGAEDEYILKTQSWDVDGAPGAIQLENMALYGNYIGNGVIANENCSFVETEVNRCKIGIYNMRMGVIDRCVIKNGGSGILKLTDSRVTNSMIHNNEVGVDATGSNDNIYSNLKIEWNGIGMRVKSSVYNTIVGCIFDRSDTYGLYLENATHVNLGNCTFERNKTNNLYMSGSAMLINGVVFAQKNWEDDQSGAMVPTEHIKIQSLSDSFITGCSFLGGKCFNDTSQFTENLVVDGNTLNGKSEYIFVTIPSTTIVAGARTGVNIAYPTLYAGNGYSYQVVDVEVQTAGNAFPRIHSSENFRVEQYLENLLLRYNNTGTEPVVVSGRIKLKHVTWNQR